MNKSCVVCGSVFHRSAYYMSDAAWQRRQFCSQACAYKGRVQRAAQTPPCKSCVVCKKIFYKQPKQGRWDERRTCSQECAVVSRRKLTPLACVACGVTFQPDTSKRKFCSLPCAASVHKGKPGVKGKPARYKKTKGVLEHRAVMEKKLGRPLVRGETVHHRNGVKNDNHPDNLELWFTPQPGGQRVPDLIAYVVEHHAEAVRSALRSQLSSLLGEQGS